MKNKDVISLSLDVTKIMLMVCILIGLVVTYNKFANFEMPDFKVINELVDKFEPLLSRAEPMLENFEPLFELVNELADPTIRYYFREGKNFLQRCDSIDCADLMISLLPAMNKSYADGSCE